MSAHEDYPGDGVRAYVPNAVEQAIADAIGEHFGPFHFDGWWFRANRPAGRGDPLTGKGRRPRHGSANIMNNLGLSMIEMCGEAALTAHVKIASPWVIFGYQPTNAHPCLEVPERAVPAWMYESAARAWEIVDRARKAIDAGAEGFASIADIGSQP